MARVPIEEGFFRIPDDPAEQPAPAREPLPGLRRGVLPPGGSCAPSACTRAPRTPSCRHRERSTPGPTATSPCSGRRTPTWRGTAWPRSTCPRGHGCSRSSRGAGTTSPSACRWRSISRPCGTTRRATRSSSTASGRPTRGAERRGRVVTRGLRFDGVAVAGIGMVRFGMLRDTPSTHLARDAGLLALHDAGMTLADVDEAFVGYIQPGSMLGIKAMKELGLTGLPVTHIENASATGLVAFRDAAWAVSSGRADVAMALGFDKFTDMTGAGGRGAGQRPDRRAHPARRLLRPVGAAADVRAGHHGPSTFATIAAKNWNYGAACPSAHRRSDHVVTRRGGPGRPDGGRAADHHDVLPARRRRGVRDPGPRGPGAGPPAGPAARAGPGLGADLGDLHARATPSSARSSARRP